MKVEREGKRALVAQFGGIRIGFDKDAGIDECPKQVFHGRSQLIDRLVRNACELCGVEGVAVEMHHMHKLRDLCKGGRGYKPEWVKRMIAMRRKTWLFVLFVIVGFILVCMMGFVFADFGCWKAE